MSLMGSLGLENVEHDPNNVPDGKYLGEVAEETYVHSKKDDSISHVITYKVTEGDHAGARRQEWFKLGKNPQRDEFGNITSLDITMTDQAKGWFKKRMVDLGTAPEEVGNLKPGDNVGKQVTFGVKRNGDYVNVNFVELRQQAAPTEQAPQGGITGLL